MVEPGSCDGLTGEYSVSFSADLFFDKIVVDGGDVNTNHPVRPEIVRALNVIVDLCLKFDRGLAARKLLLAGGS
jgi:hypothetical protein